MRLQAKSHCLVWGCLAALISYGSANPERDIGTAPALAEAEEIDAPAPAGMALASIGPGVLVARDTKSLENKTTIGETTPAEPEERLASVDPNITIRLARPEAEIPAVANGKVKPEETAGACLRSDECVDQYLWSIYDRTLKLDTAKIEERIKVTVKKKGKSRTVTKTVSKFVN